MSHNSFAEIILGLDEDVIDPVLSYPGVVEILDPGNVKDEEVRQAIEGRM